MAPRELLLVAGEASGDLHGAALVREIQALLSGVSFFGLGGDRLEREGMQVLSDIHELSVVGLWEVLRIIPKARRVFDHLLEEVDQREPEAAILIDFPEFNLRLAKELKKRGIPVIYYVSPQVWAWRRGRLRMISEVVDKMLVFFGFEVEFYRGSVDVVHVGHPLVDEVPQLESVWQATPEPAESFRIALLPGSRKSEIKRMLPVLLESAKLIARKTECTFVLVRARSVPESFITQAVESSGLEIEVESEDRFAAVAGSHLALCTSGTATLEVGLLGTPMIVVYRLGLLTSLMGRLLIRVRDISLVNLVLGRSAILELVQGQARPERICKEALKLLNDRSAVEACRGSLSELRPLLGEGGASRRAAEAVVLALESEGVEAR